MNQVKAIQVALGPRSYEIAIGHRSGDFASFVSGRVKSDRTYFITDANLRNTAHSLAGEVGTTGLSVAPAGEASKSLDQVAKLYADLADVAADRQTAIIAVGGGVVGDLAGFVAATYNRGLPLIMVPTSLLAMVDSAVGGKVGINLPQGKNLVGAFYQPRGVWIDTAFLDSLPDREFRSGLAEVVKYGVILDADFFAWLEANADAVLARAPSALEHIITRSCELKARVVQQDEYEQTGLRAKLNFGHTFGHAFEAVSGYGTMLHGEAVAAGMVCACRLAERCGHIGPEMTDRLVPQLQRFGLPVTPPAGDVAAWIDVMRRDKKSVGGNLRFVLPRKLGEVFTAADIVEDDVRAVLR